MEMRSCDIKAESYQATSKQTWGSQVTITQPDCTPIYSQRPFNNMWSSTESPWGNKPGLHKRGHADNLKQPEAVASYRSLSAGYFPTTSKQAQVSFIQPGFLLFSPLVLLPVTDAP